jgi:hypothetical protein
LTRAFRWPDYQALDLSRSQQAKMLKLRAAVSLSRVWQQQGKRRQAHELLAGVYAWFTEGFACVDLHEANVLLSELEAEPRCSTE